ncbi:MAG: hypothetical protein DMG65_03035 [Candidatus Angelobacter sp. Gp1-AA117]|nr:MAG: hypothetical protein DMG65_03035 [Candidatus Angelobacter sp. Gp1-AA117]
MQPGTVLQPQNVTQSKDVLKNDLVAPLWHTWLVIAFLVLPLSRMPGFSSLGALLKNADRVMVYIVQIEVQWLVILFVCLGLFLKRTSILSLVGRLWKTSEDVISDAKLAFGYFFISMFMVLISVLFGPAYKDHHYSLPGTGQELMVFLVIALGAGIGEEFMCRGYLQTQIHRFTGSLALAVIIQAFIFALAHGYNQTISGLVEKFAFGVLMSVLAQKSGSLLPGMMLHVFQDCLAGIVAKLLS